MCRSYKLLVKGERDEGEQEKLKSDYDQVVSEVTTEYTASLFFLFKASTHASLLFIPSELK